MSKKLSLIFNLILITTFLIGQQRTIEVEVSDSIGIAADDYHYLIQFSDKSKSEFFSQNLEKYISLEALKKQIGEYPEISVLAEHVIDEKPTNFLPYTALLTVTSNSALHINNLIQDIEKYLNVGGLPTRKIVKDTKEIEIKLKEKLIKRAKQRASQTANIIGKELGEIVSIKESPFDEHSGHENFSGGWTAYPPLSGLSSLSFEFIKVDETKLYYQEMTVTYELR